MSVLVPPCPRYACGGALLTVACATPAPDRPRCHQSTVRRCTACLTPTLPLCCAAAGVSSTFMVCAPQLVLAAQKGNLDAVKRYLADGADVDSVSAHHLLAFGVGNTPACRVRRRRVFSRSAYSETGMESGTCGRSTQVSRVFYI